MPCVIICSVRKEEQYLRLLSKRMDRLVEDPDSQSVNSLLSWTNTPRFIRVKDLSEK